jgi:hypothetical protein
MTKEVPNRVFLIIVLCGACDPAAVNSDDRGGDRGMSAGACRAPGTDLQAVLSQGQDLALCPSSTYSLSAPLHYKANGQKISTPSAKHPREYATLKLASSSAASAVTSQALSNLVLEKVVVDGSRGALGAYAGPENHALVLLVAGKGNTVRNVVLKNTRSWSSLQLHESTGQCDGGLVENNIVLWAGCDPRGNGCAPGDPPAKWGDGISMPCRNTVVRNNLIIDATDVGIVLFGAPGSTVEKNHVAAVSRETLGGVALVDVMDLYAVSGSKANRDAVTDYRGDRVRSNRLSAAGARIHIGVAVGPPIWFGPDWLGARTLGVSVTQNRLDGDAFGYGVVANGCEQVRIEGNTSVAQHGGAADGVAGVAATPRPFLYRTSTTVNPVALQGDFVADDALTSLLRLYRCPKTGAGFWSCDYTAAEARAAVRMAYIEMLGREPDASGWDHHTKRLLDERLSADDLRRDLMASTEFGQRYPGVSPGAMQAHRQAVWESALYDVVAADLNAGKPWPAASGLFDRALQAMASGAKPATPPAAPTCDPKTQPAPHWGVKNGQCLPSCGGLGGTSSFATPCAQNGKVDAGAAHDVPYCCKEPTAPAKPPAQTGAGNSLAKGQSLLPGQKRVSSDGRFSLIYQGDGNLVLYRLADGAALWSTGTAGAGAGVTAMQSDGNLVVYDKGGAARWASKTGASADRLFVQDDGNLVIRDAAGQPLWASGTGGQ